MSATMASLRTCWCGARIGFAGLILLGLPLAGLSWHAAWRAAAGLQAPGIPFALGAPMLAALYGLMMMGLLASMWVLMRKPAHGRLAPGATTVVKRTMLMSGLVLWLFAGLPAAVLALAESWVGSSHLPLAAALTWGLGLPAAGAALAAALIVLPAPRWVRWGTVILIWFSVVVVPVPSKLFGLPPDTRNATVLWLGMLGLGFAAWAFQRVARALTAVPSPSGDGPVRPLWQPSDVREGYGGATPHDTRWLVSPYRIGLRLADMVSMLLAAVALLVVLPRLTGLQMPVSSFLVLIVCGTAVPWLAGAWVSPHWLLLPGGLSRRHMAWRVWAGSLRNAAPRVSAITLAFALVSLAATDLPAAKCLANLQVCAGYVVLSAGVAVASLPWFRAPLPFALGPLASLVLVGGGYSIFEQRLDELAAGDLGHLLALTAGLALAMAAAGVLAVAASSRAWARYDWARMPAQPAIQGHLMGARRAGN